MIADLAICATTFKIDLSRMCCDCSSALRNPRRVMFRQSNFSLFIFYRRYCDDYVPDFVLHGTRKLNEEKLAIDLQNSVKVSLYLRKIWHSKRTKSPTTKLAVG